VGRTVFSCNPKIIELHPEATIAREEGGGQDGKTVVSHPPAPRSYGAARRISESVSGESETRE
jgi:hypothetical protein